MWPRAWLIPAAVVDRELRQLHRVHTAVAVAYRLESQQLQQARPHARVTAG
eukprot:SAG31_NODE_36328_length_314_cov_0.953488_1_plen_50_part_10